MKKLILGLFLSFLSTASLKAEATKTIFNPFTSKLDFITALTTNSVTASGCVTITTTPAGFLINASGCGSGGSGATIRVENQGSFAVNSSTVNFGIGLLATNDVGEAKVELNPASYVGNQSWSDGIADPSINVTYNVSVGTPPEWTYSNDRIETLNDLALPDLDPSRPLKTNGTQVITTGLINLSDTTNEVTGILPAGNLGSGSTHYIQNRDTLQSGATFYVSSATVGGQMSVSSVKFADGTIQISSPNLSGFLTTSSATATYFQITSTPSFMSQSSATANFLTQSSATATYFQIASTPTFMSQSSATANFLTLSSAALTYINQSSSGSFIQNRNSLQSGATFYVSSGTVSGLFTTNTIDQASGTYRSLSPGVMHIVAGSSNVTTSLVSLSTEVTGALGYSNMKFNRTFNAEQAKLPTTSPCVISNAGGLTIPALLCDASSDESVTWATLLTEYTTTTISASIYYTMASTNSGNVVHNISVMCASSTYTADLDTESFGSVNASTFTVPSSIGRLGIATMTLTSMDTGCVQGGIIIFKYTRDANAAADTAPGDIEIRKIWAREP